MLGGATESAVETAPEAEVGDPLTGLRFRNALAVAWFRIGIRILTLLLFGSAWLRGAEAVGVAPPVGTLISAVHLVVGVVILILLRRRPSEHVIALGASADVVLISLSAYLTVIRPGVDPYYLFPAMLVVFQLLLLLDALTMRRRDLGLFVAVWLLALAFGAWAGLPGSDTGMVLLAFGAYSVALSLAGSRMVFLAARAASEAMSAAAARRHRDELQVAHEQLRTAQRDAEVLSNLIVHDLRNPLAAAWAYLEQARDAVPPGQPQSREDLDVALAELGRATAMAGDLLVITRLERRDWSEPTPVDPAALLQEVERSMRAAVARTGASLAVQVSPGTPRSALLDGALVRRLLDNLLANAARHVETGDRIELAAEPAGGALRLAVRNSGPPVPQEARERLFEKHATSGGRRRWDSSGLGLYLCRLVAERHGGSIALVEREGWSVSFEAVLPVAPPTAG